MKYPKIENVSITIARNYAYVFTVYESGRRIMRHITIQPESVMLYPMYYIRDTRRITHIVYQFAAHGYMPKSIKKWMSDVHPIASFRQNPLDSDIFTMRLDTNEELVKNYEEFGYERFNY